MMNLLLSLIIILTLGSISLYLYKARKKGHKCVGCPHAKQCGKHHCSSR